MLARGLFLFLGLVFFFFLTALVLLLSPPPPPPPSSQGKIVTLDVKDVKQNWMTGPNKDNCPGCINGDEHPLWTNSDMINFVKGDITKREVQEKVEEFTKKAKTVLVVEDASHRYPDTLHRMNVIYKYVTVGSYMLVQDTKMDRFVGRLRKKYGGLKFGPMRAVDEFIQYATPPPPFPVAFRRSRITLQFTIRSILAGSMTTGRSTGPSSTTFIRNITVDSSRSSATEAPK